MKIAEWRKSKRLIKGPVVEVILVALITALVNYPNVFMRLVQLCTDGLRS